MTDEQRAVEHLLDLLSIEGLSGREGKIAERIRQKLTEAGCDPAFIHIDDAPRRLNKDFETGNLIVRLPGSLPEPPLLFSAHMDTVPLCRGAEPKIDGDRIVPRGKTGLGGDDRAGCAALVVLAETLLSGNLPHPPVTLAFLIAEEGGLYGSRAVNVEELGNPVMGFNLDGEDPADLVIAAMSAARWRAEIHGKSAHAGMEPQRGISAALIAARAICSLDGRGWLGRVEKGNHRGTSNIGSMNGGEADNQVMDEMVVTGECRSHSPAFLERMLALFRNTFERAAESVGNCNGETGIVEFSIHHDYRAFRLRRDTACVRRAADALRAEGLTPRFIRMDAGLDANNFNEKGIPTVTLGTGTHHFHTVDEYVDIPQFLTCCRILPHIAVGQ